jgi:YidC/Oxa1 family membrane protein insertase
MIDFFYNLIIFPIVQIIDFSFVFVDRVFHNPGFAIMGVSAVITICTLPLYLVAEHWQQIERDTAKKLKPKTDKIKAVFSGDEQYMILSAFYRQNHYHPVYAMRSTFGLLIQVPFFIAAYSYLSRLPDLSSASFLFISDLGAPDALLPIAGGRLNILPIAMTAINIAAGIIYTQGFPARDKIQLYGMALVFLLLLYNSPSGLVLYWTLNNIFSLIKNILSKSKKARAAGFVLLCAGVLFMDAAVLFFLNVSIPKRMFFAALSSLVFFLPLIRIAGKRFTDILEGHKNSLAASAAFQDSAFILSGIIIFLLAGLVIPGSTISSSVEEFSFIESYTSPFPFLLNTLVQSAGLFLFWPLCIYFLFSKKIKICLTLTAAFAVPLALVNTFVFPSYYGFLTITLIFSQPPVFNTGFLPVLLNLLTAAVLSAVFAFLLFCRKKILFRTLQIILLISLGTFGLLKVFDITGEYAKIAAARNNADYTARAIEPVYSFSQKAKNVLVIMLDRAIGGFVPYIFNEKEEIAKGFTGFTWFPNCVSHSSYTLLGAPPLFGGYEYTPLEMNKRKDDLLRSKYNESLLLMPRIFLDAGYEVCATDIPYAEPEIFAAYPQIRADNLMGKYSAQWLEKHPETRVISIPGLLKSNLVRLSYFKFLPPFLRIFLYDDGEWFTRLGSGEEGGAVENRGKLTLTTIDSLSVLDLLPELTEIRSDVPGTLTIMVSNLTHDPAFFEYPEYDAVTRAVNLGNGPFSQDPYYHVNMKAFLLLEKWFAFLKENQVYDNTRIIIVSDHGSGLSKTPGNVIGSYSAYNPLLIYKDFDSSGSLSTDETFMTNADTPLLAVKNIIANPVNPFTGKPLTSNKDDGAIISTMRLTDFNDHSRYVYKIPNDAWLHVRDNIFDSSNWQKETVSE